MDDKQLLAGEFKIMVPLAKAVEEDGVLYVEGIASDTGLDLQKERISLQGQESMASWARKGVVVLGGEADHYKIAFDDDLGKVIDGAVTENADFYIRSQLDQDNPRAVGLWKSLANGKQLGLSVFGKVTDFSNENGVPTIDGVMLTRVMVTPSPANPRTWLESIAKSIVAGDAPAEPDVPDLQTMIDAAKTVELLPDPPADPEPADLPEIPDAVTVAKGALKELMDAEAARVADLKPFWDEVDRLDAIEDLLWFAFDIAYDAAWNETLTTEQRAAVVRETIDEFKVLVAAKKRPAEPEGDDLMKNSSGGPASFTDIASKLLEDDIKEATLKAEQETVAEQPIPQRDAVRIARSFAEAVDLIDNPMGTPEDIRAGVQAALTKTAVELDTALAAQAPGDADMPNWAKALMQEVSGLSKAVATLKSVNVDAGSRTTHPDTVNKPTRKSQAPEIRASAVIQTAKSFGDIVETLFAPQLILP